MTKRNNVTLAILSIILYMTCAIGFATTAAAVCAVKEMPLSLRLLTMLLYIVLASYLLFCGASKIFTQVPVNKDEDE